MSDWTDAEFRRVTGQTQDGPGSHRAAPQPGVDPTSGHGDQVRAQPGNDGPSCQCDASGCPIHDPEGYERGRSYYAENMAAIDKELGWSEP